MYSKILIDTSNFYMRAYSVCSGMTNKMDDGSTLITGGIYNFIRMVRSVENRFLSPEGTVYFLFDNSHSGIDRRKKIDPEYKSNRTKKDEGFYRSMDILQALMLNYKDNWYCVKKAGYEADDLVYPLMKEFSNEKILLVSNDLDWFRGISENVHVAKYEKAEGMQKADYVIYDSNLFIKRLGFKPSVSSMILYKAFRGDGSDNIPPGVPGIRSDSLNKIICARFEELFTIIRKELAQFFEAGLVPRVILTGGVSKTKDLDILAAAVLGAPCEMGNFPEWVKPSLCHPEYATALGLLSRARDDAAKGRLKAASSWNFKKIVNIFKR